MVVIRQLTCPWRTGVRRTGVRRTLPSEWWCVQTWPLRTGDGEGRGEGPGRGPEGSGICGRGWSRTEERARRVRRGAGKAQAVEPRPLRVCPERPRGAAQAAEPDTARSPTEGVRSPVPGSASPPRPSRDGQRGRRAHNYPPTMSVFLLPLAVM